jgi:exopolysaccharide biosynthesis polyprenyl glycosylphosphotransferase
MIRLFRVFIPASVLALVFFDILIAFACFLVSGYFFHDGDFSIYLLYEGGFANLSLAVTSLIAVLYFQDLYAPAALAARGRSLLVQQIVLAIGGLFISQALLAYIDRGLMTSRYVLLTGSVLYLIVEPLWRRTFASSISRNLGRDRLLFLGSSETIQSVIQWVLAHPELGMSCVGVIDDEKPVGTEVAGAKVLGSIQDLEAIISEKAVDRIVVGMTERRARLPMETLLNLRFSGVQIEEVARTYETVFGRVCVQDLRPSQLIFGTDLGPRPRSLRIQVLYSMLIAGIALLVVSPLLLLVAIAVKLTSRGPVLFRQTRTGMHGIPFTVYKFRSMVADAEAKTGAVWASRSDPRVTTVGRFIRKTRLDELPQLFNVLRGEMSIVGPRPERPEFVQTLSELIPFYRQRHYVRPGITGWAQINYKYGETVQDTIVKLEYDLYYIKNVSLSLDVFIMFHTVKVMLFSGMGQ